MKVDLSKYHYRHIRGGSYADSDGYSNLALVPTTNPNSNDILIVLFGGTHVLTIASTFYTSDVGGEPQTEYDLDLGRGHFMPTYSQESGLLSDVVAFLERFKVLDTDAGQAYEFALEEKPSNLGLVVAEFSDEGTNQRFAELVQLLRVGLDDHLNEE